MQDLGILNPTGYLAERQGVLAVVGLTMSWGDGAWKMLPTLPLQSISK
jgi:hypothetical protein